MESSRTVPGSLMEYVKALLAKQETTLLERVADQWYQLCLEEACNGFVPDRLSFKHFVVPSPGRIELQRSCSVQPFSAVALSGGAEEGLFNMLGGYLTLLALSRCARTRDHFQQKGIPVDLLLLGADDFDDPERSASFLLLGRSSDPDVVELSGVLAASYENRVAPAHLCKYVRPDPGLVSGLPLRQRINLAVCMEDDQALLDMAKEARQTGFMFEPWHIARISAANRRLNLVRTLRALWVEGGETGTVLPDTNILLAGHSLTGEERFRLLLSVQRQRLVDGVHFSLAERDHQDAHDILTAGECLLEGTAWHDYLRSITKRSHLGRESGTAVTNARPP